MTCTSEEIAVAARCLALDAAAVETCAVFRARGVDVVLLKGAGLARRLASERRYVDVDLLVAPDSFQSAERVLLGLGCRPVAAGFRPDDLPLDYARTWRWPGAARLSVDLHRGFAGVSDAAEFWRIVWTSVEEITLAGGRVAVPDRDCAALIVALHAAAPGSSSRPRADLNRALHRLPIEAWRAAASIARRCGAEEAYGVGLRITDRGAAVASELGLPERCSPSRWLGAHHGSTTAYSLARLAEMPTFRSRVRHVGRRLWPSPAAMRQFNPLARHGQLGLLLAYAGRIFRYLADLPGALREVRAARVAAGGGNPSGPAEQPVVVQFVEKP